MLVLQVCVCVYVRACVRVCVAYNYDRIMVMSLWLRFFGPPCACVITSIVHVCDHVSVGARAEAFSDGLSVDF